MFDMDEKFRQERAQERANEAYRRARERERDRADAVNRQQLAAVGSVAGSVVGTVIRAALILFLLYLALSIIGIHPLLAIPAFLIAGIVGAIVAVVWFIKKLWHWDVR